MNDERYGTVGSWTAWGHCPVICPQRLRKIQIYFRIFDLQIENQTRHFLNMDVNERKNYNFKYFDPYDSMYVFTYSFMVYITTFSVVQLTQSRMLRWLLNNELKRICKEVVLVWVELLPRIWLQELRKIARNLRQVSRPPGPELNSGPPDYEEGPRRSRKETEW
jgi:hypothetical protein